MRGRLQVLVDGDVTFPLIDEPIAHAKLKAQLLHISVKRIEVLVVQHPRRHVNGVALIPVITFAADLRITVAFQRVEIGFGMGMAVALGVRQVDKDRADRDAGGLETVLLPLRPIKK